MCISYLTGHWTVPALSRLGDGEISCHLEIATMGDEKFCKQDVKSADYSTLCMTTVSEDNTYASVITNELPSEDKKVEVKKEEYKACVHIHWLAAFAFIGIIMIMASLIAIHVNIAELKAANYRRVQIS